MRGRKKTNETRLAIIRCAAEIFSEREFHEVLTDDIAQRLGIGKGTIYRYFGSKEDLYLEAIGEGLRGLHAAVTTVLQQDAPLAATVEAVVRTMINYFWRQRDFFVLLHRLEQKLKARDRADWREHRNEVVAMIRRVIEHAAARGEISRVNTRLAVEVLFGMIRGVCVYRAESDRPEDLTRLVTAIFLRGVAGEARVAPNRARPLASCSRRNATSMKVRLVVPALALAAITLSGCDHAATSAAIAAEAQAVAVPVTVAPVVVRPSSRLVNFVGTLYGKEEVTLSSQVEGQIKSLVVDLGDQVQSGQVLAEIDDDQWRARLREAEATLAKAQADEARGRQLRDRNVISAQEYETMKTHAQVVQAQRDTLTVTLRHTRVESPITGAVAKRFVSAGEYVHAGSQLFSLVAENPLKLRGDVPERFAHELQVGQTVNVKVDAYPDAAFTGRLARISPASNPENRSVAVEALVDNQDRKLKPGFFANASVVTRTDDRALMVPQEGLVTFAGVTKLFVISDGTARERQVQIGPRGSGGLVEIVEGVQPDELVATSGLTKLGNGVAVTVRAAGAVSADPSK